MGATAVILFAVPNSPMARPWAVVGGHLLSGSIGMLCAHWDAAPWAASAAAVGLSILAMHLSRCLHPPGGASALIPVLGGNAVTEQGPQFLLLPLGLNVITLLATALIFQSLRRQPRSRLTEVPSDPPPLERLGIRGEDVHAAVLEMNAFVDISEDDLNTLYNLAATHAYRREFGTLTCAHIMTRGIVAVEFGDDLERIWKLMQQRGIAAIPVIDRGRHVLGMITLADFLRHAGNAGFRGLGDRLRDLTRRTTDVISSKPEVAGQIMTRPAATAREDTPITEIAEWFAADTRHIAIVDAQGRLTGLVAPADLIGAMHRMIDGPTSAEAGPGPTAATAS
jgi:CBS domain-containing membrane protein